VKKEMKTLRVGKNKMLLDDWLKAKDLASAAFAEKWNSLMLNKVNHIKGADVERLVDDWLWNRRSGEVLR
jgi:hypothetical protein